MDFNVLFVIVQFLHTVLSFDTNSSSNTCNFCPLSLVRRKRANIEYTRWLQNIETTEQFIVKVLDDDVTTPRTHQVIAVNIQPVTKGAEKIIISGVKLPSQTAITVTEQSSDYTRFNALTTLNVDRKSATIYPKPKYVSKQYLNRDESPPASPQFVPHSKLVPPQQYAPIAPVSFTRRQTPPPVIPKRKLFESVTKSQLTQNEVSRTSPDADIVIPLRTDGVDDRFPFQHFHIPNAMMTTSSTNPSRTSYETKPLKIRKNDHNDIVHEKETESYMNPFYNDDDGESISTKRFKPVENNSEKIDRDDTDDKEDTEGSGDVDYKSEASTTLDRTTPKLIKYEADNDTVSCSSNVPLVEKFSFLGKASKINVRRREHSVCNVLSKRELDLNTQRTLQEIVKQLKNWAEKSPVAKSVDITHGNFTVMENPIYMMIVDDPSRGQIVSAKETVMIVAGIQGKDHYAVAAAMFLLYQLIERSESHAELLTKYRFWIIPVFNPDGYDYSMTFPQRRLWLKNLRQTWTPCKGGFCDACQYHGIGCTIQPCYGVNLDRNFEYQWIPTATLKAEHPCGELYAGPRQLSEVETHSLTQYLHNLNKPLHTFIAFKEGDVLGVMYPYSHTKKKRALDHVYRQRALRAANAAYTISGRPYVAGQTSEFLPLYAGGVDDWVDGHLGVDNTYTIMIFRATDSKDSKLVMERVVHEAYAATHTLLVQAVEQAGSPPPLTLTRSRATTTSPSLARVIVAILTPILGYG